MWEGSLWIHVGTTTTQAANKAKFVDHKLHHSYIPMYLRNCVDFGTMYEGTMKKQIKSDHFRQPYPIFFIIHLIYCDKINKNFHIHRRVTSMELRSNFSNTEATYIKLWSKIFYSPIPATSDVLGSAPKSCQSLHIFDDIRVRMITKSIILYAIKIHNRAKCFWRLQYWCKLLGCIVPESTL